MHNIKILILFVAIVHTHSCFSQAKDSDIAVGVYAIGFPVKEESIIILGGLLDVPLKKYEKIFSSSSINYASRINKDLSLQHISITTGISWAFQNDEICFRPGIQIGYLNISHLRTSYFYSFDGIIGRGSAELTYLFNRIEAGMHINIGMGYGPTDYNLAMGNNKNYAFELSAGIGVACKYHFGRKG